METRRRRRVHRQSTQALRWLLAGAVVCLLAAPAWAAKVVDVRVGQHAGFSRVVFELDSPAGYKVERHAPAPGVSELVVSLDAAASAQTLRRKLDFIESVEILPGTSRRSTVRIRLKGDDLKLKEMILANPPRIVLDVLNEAAIAKAKAAEKARARKKRQARATPKPAPKKEAKQVAQKQPQESQSRQRQEKREEKSATTTRAAEPQMAAATPQPPASMPAKTRTAQAPPRPPAVAPKATPGPKIRRNTLAGAQATAPPTPPANAARGAALPPAVRPAPGPKPTPAATARPKATPMKPPTPKPAAMTQPSKNGLFSLTNVGVGALGLVLLAGAGFVFWRRRNAAEVVDASAFENPLGDDNPFAGVDADATAETEEIHISEAAQAETGIPIPESDASTDIFDAPATETASVQEGKDMDMVSENAQTTIMNPPPAALGSSGGADVSNMVAEFERRMAAMETRIDELVDAKERLERQVAAQTEELRVQRAAIARTQRAVRNLNRPGEDAPTEPALRDPTRPEGPRE